MLAVGVIMWGYECGVSPAKPQWHTVELGHEIFISSLVVWSSWMSALNCPRVINTLSTARHLSKTLPQGNSLPFTLLFPLFLHSWISTHTHIHFLTSLLRSISPAYSHHTTHFTSPIISCHAHIIKSLHSQSCLWFSLLVYLWVLRLILSPFSWQFNKREKTSNALKQTSKLISYETLSLILCQPFSPACLALMPLPLFSQCCAW